jgi:hypothetical protein
MPKNTVVKEQEVNDFFRVMEFCVEDAWEAFHIEFEQFDNQFKEERMPKTTSREVAGNSEGSSSSAEANTNMVMAQLEGPDAADGEINPHALVPVIDKTNDASGKMASVPSDAVPSGAGPSAAANKASNLHHHHLRKLIMHPSYIADAAKHLVTTHFSGDKKKITPIDEAEMRGKFDWMKRTVLHKLELLMDKVALVVGVESN